MSPSVAVAPKYRCAGAARHGGRCKWEDTDEVNATGLCHCHTLIHVDVSVLAKEPGMLHPQIQAYMMAIAGGQSGAPVLADMYRCAATRKAGGRCRWSDTPEVRATGLCAYHTLAHVEPQVLEHEPGHVHPRVQAYLNRISSTTSTPPFTMTANPLASRLVPLATFQQACRVPIATQPDVPLAPSPVLVGTEQACRTAAPIATKTDAPLASGPVLAGVEQACPAAGPAADKAAAAVPAVPATTANFKVLVDADKMEEACVYLEECISRARSVLAELRAVLAPSSEMRAVRRQMLAMGGV